MGRLLRFTLILVGALCALVISVMWLGTHLPVTTRVLYISYSEVRFVYHPHLVDMRGDIRVDLVSTACDLGPPAGVVPGDFDSDPIVMYDSEGIYIVRHPPDGEWCRL